MARRVSSQPEPLKPQSAHHAPASEHSMSRPEQNNHEELSAMPPTTGRLMARHHNIAVSHTRNVFPNNDAAIRPPISHTCECRPQTATSPPTRRPHVARIRHITANTPSETMYPWRRHKPPCGPTTAHGPSRAHNGRPRRKGTRCCHHPSTRNHPARRIAGDGPRPTLVAASA